jgi:transketolase
LIAPAIIPKTEFDRINQADIDRYDKLALFADMCRLNTLVTVKKAGSGHLGSSLSSLDIVTMLYHSVMNTKQSGIKSPDRDIYFSSKGHDVPGLYSVLYSLGVIPKEKFIRLRRLGGTFGHPDVSIEGIEANSGSLGMGISKAKGFAFAKKLSGRAGRVFVMVGDGELQEGQIYEALQNASGQKIANLNVIIDHNKVQSDKPVDQIISLGNLEQKLKSFGWYVARCDGHNFRQLEKVFSKFQEETNKPKILIADTIKGRGVSFMEHPFALKAGNGLYRWHAGAPSDNDFEKAFTEVLDSINHRLKKRHLETLALETLETEEKKSSGVSDEYVANIFGDALAEIAKGRKDIVVLDADLAADCRLREFENKYPDRFIENGIAEQDMVSMAGGLALQGFLPIVNSFAAFLASRANEQIYTNWCEKTKIIYVCHYAGLIPAGPGQSHQSLRDISLFAALPDIEILQPCNALETKQALDYCINKAQKSIMLRLIIGPSPRRIELPENYRLREGFGTELTDGNDALIFGYGPVMLNEALLAAEILKKNNFGLKVVNMPWLNRVDIDWLTELTGKFDSIYVIEDHCVIGGLGDFLLSKLAENNLLENKNFLKFGIKGYAACGTPAEVLQYHRLDGHSIAERIRSHIKNRVNPVRESRTLPACADSC